MRESSMERSLISKEIFGTAIVECARENKDIIVCDADLMRCFGTKAYSREFPERHFNFGIAEQNCVAAAGGLGISGRNVFCASFANFITKRACDQVSISVAYNMANVKICGLYAGLTAEKNGGTHIGVEDVALMRATPNMKVVEPGDTWELEAVTKMLAYYEGPVYFRQPKMYLKNVLFGIGTFTFGKGTEIVPGGDIAIIACGIMTGIAFEAVEALRKVGVRARLINMSSIKPIDGEMIQKAARETGLVLTCENHSIIGGLGSAVSEVVTDGGFGAQVYRLGIQDHFAVTAGLTYQLESNGLTAANIEAQALKLLKQ